MFLAVTALAIVWLRSLIAVAMLSGIYSLLSAGVFVVLDAVDVAFTEAAVGAGITTVLLLGTLVLTDREEKPPAARSLIPLLVVLATGAALIYGTLDMPLYGVAAAPAHTHVVPEYLADAVRQVGQAEPTVVGLPNIVTSILASYRGYDTLGEVTVIFTAGIGVLLLLGAARKPEREKVKKPAPTKSQNKDAP